MTFAVVISAGPGERELWRLTNVIDSLFRFESPFIHCVVIVDDSNGTNILSPIVARHGANKVRVIPSPRKGRGSPWRGGLSTNVLFGIREAVSNDSIDFVLKVDTDSLAIGPFSNRIGDFFKSHPNAGIIGSCFKVDLNGAQVPPSTWRVNLVKHAKLARVRRRPIPHIETAFFGRKKKRRQLLRQAIDADWPLGACAQGGGYALRRAMVTKWINSKFLDDELLWLDTDLGEDVVASVLCYASGFSVVDDNGDNGVFGVQFKGLGLPLEAFFDRRNSIIHSVKDPDPTREDLLHSQIAGAVRQRVDC